MPAVRPLVRRILCQGAPVLLAGALALSACGGGAEPDDAAAAPDCTVVPSGTPSVEPPDTSGTAPTELQVIQLAEPPSPDCPEAEPGDFVAVDYTGRAWSTGEVFDSSEGRDPFTFQLGAGSVIEGWDQGIAGLQVGERARLVIPSELAYKDQGAGNGLIKPGETLVFDVQLVAILGQPSTPAG